MPPHAKDVRQKKQDPATDAFARLKTCTEHSKKCYKESCQTRKKVAWALFNLRMENLRLYQGVANAHASFLDHRERSRDADFFSRDNAVLRRHWVTRSYFDLEITILRAPGGEPGAMHMPLILNSTIEETFQDFGSSSIIPRDYSRDVIFKKAPFEKIMAFLKARISEAAQQYEGHGMLQAMLAVLQDSAPRGDAPVPFVYEGKAYACRVRADVMPNHPPRDGGMQESWQEEILDTFEECSDMQRISLFFEAAQQPTSHFFPMYQVNYNGRVLPRQALMLSDLPLVEESLTRCQKVNHDGSGAVHHRQTVPIISTQLHDTGEVHKKHVMERIFALQLGCCKMMQAISGSGVHGVCSATVDVKSCNFRMLRTAGGMIGCKLTSVIQADYAKSGKAQLLATTYYWLHTNLPKLYIWTIGYPQPRKKDPSFVKQFAQFCPGEEGMPVQVTMQKCMLIPVMQSKGRNTVRALARPHCPQNSLQHILTGIAGFKSAASVPATASTMTLMAGLAAAMKAASSVAILPTAASGEQNEQDQGHGGCETSSASGGDLKRASAAEQAVPVEPKPREAVLLERTGGPFGRMLRTDNRLCRVQVAPSNTQGMILPRRHLSFAESMAAVRLHLKSSLEKKCAQPL